MRREIFNEGGCQNIENDNERVGLVGCLQDKIIWDKYIHTKHKFDFRDMICKNNKILLRHERDLFEWKKGGIETKGGSFNKLKSKAYSGAI